MARAGWLIIGLGSLALNSHPLAAQNEDLDVVYGRVYSVSDSTPIIGATVILRAIDTGEEMTTKSREIGFYAFFWMGGRHSYTIRVAARGYEARETRIVRAQDSKPDMINDFYLRRQSSSLAPVRVLGSSRAMALRIGGGLSDRLGMDHAGATSQQLTPEEQGNINGVVAVLPDVNLTSSGDGRLGYSVFGLAPSQNKVTLNGSTFAGDAIPRDAVGFVRFSKTPFDPARGGFSGGQITLTLLPGSNNSVRTARLTTNSSGLDAALSGERAFSSPASLRQASATASGAIVSDKLFYNTSGQAGRSSSSVYSVLGGARPDPPGTGAAPDSSRSAAGTLRAFFPWMNLYETPRVSENASFLGRFDLTPFGTNAASLTLSGQRASMRGALASPEATPSHAGIATTRSIFEQLVYSRIAGVVSNDLRLSVSQNHARGRPLSLMPEGRVLAAMGPDQNSPFTLLEFGGNTLLPLRQDGHSAEAVNETSWYVAGGRHQPKVYVRVSETSGSQRGEAGRLGTYTYFSLDDLAANTPSMFERNLQSWKASATVSALDASLGDLWQPAPSVLVQYGVRFSRARYRVALSAAEGEETDPGAQRPGAPPTSSSLSPRLGFKWTYGRRTLSTTDFPGHSTGQLRGGFGVFRNDLTPDRLMTAVSGNGATGLRLICVGGAIPPANWGAPVAYAPNPDVTCSGSSDPNGAMGAIPSRAFFSRGYTPETSLRALLGWNHTLEQGWTVGMELTTSTALHQPGSIDTNFPASPGFELSAEGGRPVYVPAEAISSSGVPSVRASRLRSELGSTRMYVSDLRSHAIQETFTVRTPYSDASRYSFDVGYTLSSARESERGFGGGSTDSNPIRISWGSSMAVARHRIVVNGLWRVKERTELSVTSALKSGSRYTPLVGSDINGDGESNDRAFVFGAATPDTTLRNGMASLIEGASRQVRQCLRTQSNRIAARASCTGPWGATFDARLTTTPDAWFGRRATFTLSIIGLPMLADRLLHGRDGQRGWGQVVAPDPVLLMVRGFDPVARRYRYDINPNFGKTSAASAALSRYSGITIDAHFLLGALPPGMTGITRPITRKSSAENTVAPEALASRRASFDGAATRMLEQVLSISEELRADSAQVAALAELRRRYAAVADSAWTVLQQDAAPTEETVDRTERFLDQILTGIASVIRDILRPDQYRRLPTVVRLMLEDPVLRRTLAKP